MPNPWEMDWSKHTVVQAPRGQRPMGQSTAAKQAIETSGQIEAAGGKKLAEAESEAKLNIPAARKGFFEMQRNVGELLSHPGFSGSVGVPSLAGMASQQPEDSMFKRFSSGTNEAGWKSLYDQIKSGSFLEAYTGLKGGGQITEIEGEKATNARNRLHPNMTENEFKQVANQYIKDVNENLQMLEAKSKGKFNEYQPSDSQTKRTTEELLKQYLPR